MISAEARGLRRIWLREISRSAIAIEKIIGDSSIHYLIDRVHLAGAVGKIRARKKLMELRSLRNVHWHDRDKLLGVFLSYQINGVIKTPGDIGQTQSAVTTRYIYLSIGSSESGLWTLEIPDHAIGRIFERSKQSPKDVILSAHQAALNTGFDPYVRPDHEYLLPAGDGFLVVQFVFGKDGDTTQVYLRARTFLDEGMIVEEQVQRILLPNDNSLGDGLFLPIPLRELDIMRDGILVQRRA